MSAPVTAFPSFHDLKKRNAHSGGFSDGGVLCISQPLSSSPVDLAPVPGTCLGGFSVPAGAGILSDSDACALIMNFDLDDPVIVEVYMVHEDGSTKKLYEYDVAANSVEPAPLAGLVLTYPNKLRYKLVASSGYSLPTGRVLLKAALVEYDKPRDLEAA